MDVTIVCHTEYGLVKGREVVYRKSALEGVTRGVRSMVSTAGRYRAKVTFAVMPETVWSVPGEMTHEIGLHVHPGWEEHTCGGEVVPVGDRYLRERCGIQGSSSVLPDYTFKEQLALIRAGKDRIEDVLYVTPEVFVAGRWSINDDTVKALVQSGFTHDCSAVPSAGPAHYDWSRLPRICMPYHPHEDDYQRRGRLPLLMVPASRALMGVTASPEIVPLVGLPWLKACFQEYYRQGLPLFHVCLHSPCMTDPYFKSAMDRLLHFISRHDVTFRFASEIREYEGPPPKTDVRPYLTQGLNRQMLSAARATGRRLAERAATRIGAAVRH